MNETNLPGDEVQERFRQAFYAAKRAGRDDLAPLLRDIAWYWRYEKSEGCEDIWRALVGEGGAA